MNLIRFFGITNPEYLTPNELAGTYEKTISNLIDREIISEDYRNLLYELSIILKSCSDFAYSNDQKKYMEKFSTINAWMTIRPRLALILIYIQLDKIKKNFKKFFRLKSSTAN